MSKAATTEAVERVRPLTATQATALRKLVENDYEALSVEINQFAEEQADAAEERVRADYSDKEAIGGEYVREARALARDYEDKRRALIDRASINGIALSVPDFDRGYRGTPEPDFAVIGLDQAVRNARQVIYRDRNAAQSALQRSKTDSMRTVLQASLTADAEAVLSSMPSAADMMRQVQERKAAALIERA